MSTKPKTKAPRVILFGLDGADPDFILSHRGKFPFLSGLIERGGMGGLASTLPPFTLTAWSTGMSGMNPGKTGVNCFPREDFVPTRIEVDSTSVKTARIWDIVSANGLRTATLNVPLTFPVSQINGCMISSFLTPEGAQTYTWPPELKEKLPTGYRTSLGFEEHRSREEVFLEHLKDFTDKQFEAARTVLEMERWDLFSFVLSGTDWIQHYYGLMKLDPSEAEGKICSYFSQVDHKLEQLWSGAGEADFVVISDHGFGKIPTRSLALNSWLVETGDLVLNPTAPRGGRQLLTPARIRALGKLPLAAQLRKLLPLSFKEKTLRASRPKARDLDPAATRAHFALFMNHTGYIRLQAGGQEREELRDQLIKRLQELGDNAPGGPVFHPGHSPGTGLSRSLHGDLSRYYPGIHAGVDRE